MKRAEGGCLNSARTDLHRLELQVHLSLLNAVQIRVRLSLVARVLGLVKKEEVVRTWASRAS